MFVSIDMDNLVFLHKHHDREAISALAFLEAPDRSTLIEATDRDGFLDKMSKLDLSILYKNTTSASVVNKETYILRLQLRELVSNMEPTLALLDELQAQIKAVEPQLEQGKPFRYVLGAKLPAEYQQLFPLKAAPLSPPQVAAAERAAQAPSVPPVPPARPQRPTGSQAPAAGQTTPKPPRAKHSVRPEMYAVANELLAAKGGNTSADVLKAVKDEAFAILVERGYNPTTSRIKMTEWFRENNIH